MRSTMPIRTELDARALNGESPRWRREDGRLYWVDTLAPSFHAYDPVAHVDRAWELPSWVGCHVLAPDGALLALRTGLFEFQFGTGAIRQVGIAPYDCRRFTFNDGGCDPLGRFLVGEMYMPLGPDIEGEAPDSAPLYRLAGTTWVDMAAPTKTSNGLAWSPDGRTMYRSDTASKVVYAFDYDVAHGQASHRRVFASVETRDDKHGPDGAVVDEHGFYLCAVFGEGCLLRFDPDGVLERRIAMPVQYPTMPAFGGADLSTVFVTSSSYMIDADDRASRPLEGGLFSFEAPVKGLPPTPFDRMR